MAQAGAFRTSRTSRELRSEEPGDDVSEQGNRAEMEQSPDAAGDDESSEIHSNVHPQAATVTAVLPSTLGADAS